MTSLNMHGTASAATTLTVAGKSFNSTGGTSGNVSTNVGTSTQFKQIFALGTATGQTGVASIPTPTDSNFAGWIWDNTGLEGQEMAAGTWTPTFHLLASTGTTVTPTIQWFKRSSAGGYTSIGSIAGSSIALTTSAQLLVFTAPSLSLMDFATGDKLVMWLWVNQTAGGATNSTISVVEAISGSTLGTNSEAQAVTPGYAPIQVALSATIAGVGTLAATITEQTALMTQVSPIIITNAGCNLVRDGESGANNPLITYVALGASSVAPTISDTTLGAEIFRRAVTSRANGVTGEILITLYLAEGDVIGTNIQEVGFFGGSSASALPDTGVLIAHGLYSHSKSNTESIQFTLDLVVNAN